MTNTNPALNEWKNIHNSNLIGFDELFRRIAELDRPKVGFPPYDIIKHSEDDFVIKLAVAGYKKENISVTLELGKLTVTGYSEKEQKPVKYEYKGIAERDFKREFTLADTVEVEKVTLSDGMLYIVLKNVIPENKKPRKFVID